MNTWFERLLRYVYNVLFYAAIPIILCRLLWRSRDNVQYRKRWSERFGYVAVDKKWQQGLWIHAVSVGEVVAATPLIKNIRKKYPTLAITLTTMTITGSQRVQHIFGDEVLHYYVPYDMINTVKRFLIRVKPQAVILLETELWPNIMATCQAKKIPVMLANARLSERSVKDYRFIAALTRPMVRHISVLAAHADAD
ncbi:MAG: 3-deoxy-D-manno-octulosonic acid transferase, partial [Gammaproteobacteria bacterium]|nr:3-deoxy-D-manno-octulosonic acid transferase [Gammaproteobacteria bacterium]